MHLLPVLVCFLVNNLNNNNLLNNAIMSILCRLYHKVLDWQNYSWPLWQFEPQKCVLLTENVIKLWSFMQDDLRCSQNNWTCEKYWKRGYSQIESNLSVLSQIENLTTCFLLVWHTHAHAHTLNNNQCQCDSPVDAREFHSFVCRRAPCKSARHHAFTELVARCFASAGTPVTRANRVVPHRWKEAR